MSKKCVIMTHCLGPIKRHDGTFDNVKRRKRNGTQIISEFKKKLLSVTTDVKGVGERWCEAATLCHSFRSVVEFSSKRWQTHSSWFSDCEKNKVSFLTYAPWTSVDVCVRVHCVCVIDLCNHKLVEHERASVYQAPNDIYLASSSSPVVR